MFKRPSFWLAAGVSTAVLTWFALKPKKAHAAPSSAQSMLLIGDSQTARTLGEAFTNAFSDMEVTYFGKPGATHEDYLKSPELINRLATLPCADIVYIQLGDNGVSARVEKIREFKDILARKCPHAKMFWGGPMKAVTPTITLPHPYVVTDDTAHPRYLPAFNEMRKVWNSRLANTLEGTRVTFIDNYALQESQPPRSAFSDSRKGDGIHLTPESADALAVLIKRILEEAAHA